MLVFADLLLPLCLVVTAGSQVAYVDHYQYTGVDYEEEESRNEATPVFTAKGQRFSVEIGGEITFPCQVENQGKYVLMFKQALPDGEQLMLFVGNLTLKPSMRLSKVGNSFTLSGVRRSHAGRYVCRIETSPAIEVTHTLDVQYPASVRRVGETVRQVLKGSTVTLECVTDGNPPAAITWSHQRAHLPPGVQSSKQGQSTITLENVDKHLEGTYTCTASNGVGGPSSASTTIQGRIPTGSIHGAGDRAHGGGGPGATGLPRARAARSCSDLDKGRESSGPPATHCFSQRTAPPLSHHQRRHQ
ncbi:lachesin-like [Scylla paramamosain]|uniref:lachesin-like n=1 Tax=Scylla paramamosain TaxID=85552 RepID=UPI00308367DF